MLIGPREPRDEAQQLAGVFRSVVDARGARYLMLNAPEASLEAICALVPGSRAPSVLPLAEPGMVAVHSVVPAHDVWRLLPALEAAGASSILLVPLERMLGMSGVAEIVDDVRARGDAALREWALRLDGVEPARATPADELPEDAVLALADRVRRWHEAQRPADVRLEVEPGVELERRWVPLALGRHLRPARRSSRRSSCARCRRRSRASSASSS